jgi:hypothetical protein
MDEELRELLVDLKREVVSLKTEILLIRYAVEQVERMQIESKNNQPGTEPADPFNNSQFRVEKL